MDTGLQVAAQGLAAQEAGAHVAAQGLAAHGLAAQALTSACCIPGTKQLLEAPFVAAQGFAAQGLAAQGSAAQGAGAHVAAQGLAAQGLDPLVLAKAAPLMETGAHPARPTAPAPRKSATLKAVPECKALCSRVFRRLCVVFVIRLSLISYP
ncbi:hypothetical protein [Blastomonas sp.]|uniref:hypothetical protein n=1 Tax=Blastomonas sp. TaxID=1909299 RepID=UPI003593EF6E